MVVIILIKISEPTSSMPSAWWGKNRTSMFRHLQKSTLIWECASQVIFILDLVKSSKSLIYWSISIDVIKKNRSLKALESVRCTYRVTSKLESVVRRNNAYQITRFCFQFLKHYRKILFSAHVEMKGNFIFFQNVCLYIPSFMKNIICT